MMSRNFTPEQTLIDRLLTDDTEAFEELARRYCFSLYSYCFSKLSSSDDSRRIVRNIFIALWEERHTLPINFSMSLYLYTEVRKAVVQCVNNKLNNSRDIQDIEKQIIPGFGISQLQQARQPVKKDTLKKSNTHSSVNKKKRYEEQWWNPEISLEGIRRALKSMMNTW